MLGGLAHLAGHRLRLGPELLAQFALAGQAEFGRAGAGGLGAVHAVVVPGFHIVLEAVAGLQVERAQVPGVGVGAGAFAGQGQGGGALRARGRVWALARAAQGVVQRQPRQAIIVAHGASQGQVAPRHGIRKRLQRERRGQVGHGGELVRNGVFVQAGRVFQAQHVGLGAQHPPRGHKRALAAGGGQGVGRVLKHQGQFVGGGRGKLPAQGAALRYRQVAAVLHGFGGLARVGRVGDVDLKIAQIWPFQHRQLVLGRAEPGPFQLERHGALRLLKGVAEPVVPAGYLAQPPFAAIEADAYRRGQGRAGHAHVQRKVLAPKHRQLGVFNYELERGGWRVRPPVVPDALRALHQKAGIERQQRQQHRHRHRRVLPQRPALLLNVDAFGEGKRAQLRRPLLQAGRNQGVVAGLALQLQGVQQAVLHFGKQLPYPARGLLVAEQPAQVGEGRQGRPNPAPKAVNYQPHKPEQQPRPHPGGQVKKVLEPVEYHEQREQEPAGHQQPAHQQVEVELALEGLQLRPYPRQRRILLRGPVLHRHRHKSGLSQERYTKTRGLVRNTPVNGAAVARRADRSAEPFPRRPAAAPLQHLHPGRAVVRMHHVGQQPGTHQARLQGRVG